MKILRNIGDLKKEIIMLPNLGFVPTMGGLHKGHISLIKESKKNCKKTKIYKYFFHVCKVILLYDMFNT